MTREQIIAHEGNKTGPDRVTGSNFSDFETWGLGEYILRFTDSSTTSRVVNWRDRVASFKKTKLEEGENGRQKYGMTTWDKLGEIMTVIEHDLYSKITAKRPDLARKYPEPIDLFCMVRDSLIEKIETA